MIARGLACCIALLLVTPAASALQADELLLIVNGNVPASMRTAEFYANARLVPEGRILKLNLPGAEEIPFDRYESEIVPAIRQCLRERGLENQVKCLVMFYGVPFRIGSKQTSSGEREEIAKLKEQLEATHKKLIPIIEQTEKLALKLNDKFSVNTGTKHEQLLGRAEAALHAITRRLPRAADPNHREVLVEIVKLIGEFGGDAKLAERLSNAQAAEVLPAEKLADWPQRRKEIEKYGAELAELQEKRFDPDSRHRMRDISADAFGLFGLAGVLHAQLEYLNNDGTVSAFDNELALLWWNFYTRSKWQGNPLNYRNTRPHSPVMMVMRLDGPQDGTAMQIILASLKAEREGLKGRIVVDSNGGTAPGGIADTRGGYREYDHKLLRLGEIVQKKTNFALTLDKRSTVLPPHSVRDVALYAGWYSVRNYVPACQFKAGAVGYHTASYEMVSLRSDTERGWVAGLLSDGIAATLGAVAEPYLASFPLPDEFFPLLMTGKLTLAEVYWKTTPMTSWMITCIGDPLYTPFKVNPLLKVEDLDPELQRAVDVSYQTSSSP